MTYSFAKSTHISGVGTTYDVNKKAEITLSHSASKYFLSRLASIQVYCTDITSASTLSIKMTSGSNGDTIFLVDTAAELDFDLTTTDNGCAEFTIDSILYSPTEDFYIFIKLDSGTCDVSHVYVTFENP